MITFKLLTVVGVRELDLGIFSDKVPDKVQNRVEGSR